jgi:NADPH:quinone reductase-like Zn-dependent oxidoreductase
VQAQLTEEKTIMKAIVVTDQAAGTAGMKLAERPKPQAAINDVVVQVYASGFAGTELSWPSTWTDRLNRDPTPTIPGKELAGVVIAARIIAVGTEPSRLEVVAFMREQHDSSKRRRTREFASDDGRVDAGGTGLFG